MTTALLLLLLGCGDDDVVRTAQVSPPTGTFTQVSVGTHQACALRGDGRAVCWGEALGVGLKPPSSETFTRVEVGTDFACGITSEGMISCWGDPLHGKTSPPEGVYSDFDLEHHHGCALGRMRGQVVCWGNLGHPVKPPRGNFVKVRTGFGMDCGLSVDGVLDCWGLLPEEPDHELEGSFITFSLGAHHLCGVRRDGDLSCAWSDLHGESSPPGDHWRFVTVDAGVHHTCGVESDNSVQCWGLDLFGETEPPSDVAFTDVSAGANTTCGVTTDQQLVCWGAPFHRTLE